MQLNRLLFGQLPKIGLGKMILLTGARQVGKTTLAKIKYADLPYYNLDSPELRDDVRSVSAENWGSAIGVAVLDEAQKLPNMFEKIKYAYDEKKISSSIILGSSQILLLKQVQESLAGRIFLYQLWPLLLCELNSKTDHLNLELINTIFTRNPISIELKKYQSVLIGVERAELQKNIDYLLKWGGMPGLLQLEDQYKYEWLKSYEYTYLERDLADLARLHDLQPFRKFQKILAHRSGQMINYSDLARDAGFSVETARKYMEYLQISYQVFFLQPYYRNITSTLVKTPKVYFTDIGILRQLMNYWGEVTGEIFETMVVGEIYKIIKTLNLNIELYYYRTRSGMEVDLLVKTNQGIIGLEVKHRERLYHKDFNHLKTLAEGLGQEWLGGICVYKGAKLIELDKHYSIWGIPAARLFS